MALYRLANAVPVKTWIGATSPDPASGSGHAPVLSMEWSPKCPTVLFLLDLAGALLVWDFARDTDRPVLEHNPDKPVSDARGSPLFSLSSTTRLTMPLAIALLDTEGALRVLHNLGPDADPPNSHENSPGNGPLERAEAVFAALF
jgi:hypothetical protein